MKPRILAIVPALIPSTIINVVTPVVDLHYSRQITARVAMEPYVNERDLEWCDLVILCRNTDPQTGQWFLKLLQSKKPYIYDIDDNFFELSPDTPIGKYHTAPKRLNRHKQYIQLADLVRIYSKPMYELVRAFNDNAIRVTGPVDWRLLTPAQKSADPDVVKIVYATSRVKDTLAELFEPALHQILQKYASQIEVYFLGYNPPEFKIYPNVFYKPLTLNYEKYLRNFSSAGFDIGLAPLLDDIFHRSKTNLKVREYGACRIAGIYSDVDVYASTVIRGKTGLLVKNTSEAWFHAMSELIENKQLRIDIQEQAYQYAQEHYSHIAFNQLWYQQIVAVLQRPSTRKNEQEVMEFLPPSAMGNTPKNLIFQKIPVLWRMILFFNWLQLKIRSAISGIKSEGITYLIHVTRFYVETAWMLTKIKLKLLVHKT